MKSLRHYRRERLFQRVEKLLLRFEEALDKREAIRALPRDSLDYLLAALLWWQREGREEEKF